MYSGPNNDWHESKMEFYIIDKVLDFKQLDSKTCMLQIELKCYNMTLVSLHEPSE